MTTSNISSRSSFLSSKLSALLSVCFLGATLSACTAQVGGNTVARAPASSAPRALTMEPTDVILGQRPAETPLETPSVRTSLIEDAQRRSQEEFSTRQTAANAALSRAGRVGSKSVGQSARWSSLNR
ncbi:MAG: hypothetical protein H6718_23705 [Polyangiaceae bacterium]|nr:hypothetical protein [Myxococcales bacterium]MCB9588434.1 hypothetical protein [Polyangiaceae bacterium]